MITSPEGLTPYYRALGFPLFDDKVDLDVMYVIRDGLPTISAILLPSAWNYTLVGVVELAVLSKYPFFIYLFDLTPGWRVPVWLVTK